MDVSAFSLLFTLLIVIILIFTYYNQEGFKNPTLHIPQSPVAQKNLVETYQDEYAPSSSTSLGPAPGTIATVNSRPSKDPILEKANTKQLEILQAALRSFLELEAPNIQESSENSIQLSLTLLRSNLNKLDNEVKMLKENPGKESSVTQDDIDDMYDNLTYLEKTWRQNPQDSIEAFQDDYGSSSNYDSLGTASNYNYVTSASNLSNYNSVGAASNYNYVTTASNLSNYNSNIRNTSNTSNFLGNLINTVFSGSNTSNTSNTSSSNNNISLNDLRTLITKIDVTIARLTSSGTTDPIVLARVDVLNKMKQRINSIISDVISGVRDEKDIPITKDAMDNFLKSIANTSSPLSQLFGSNVALADLFPAYSAGDTDGAMFSQYLFKQYGDMLFKGLSWNVGFDLKYTSENERSMANSLANAISSSIPNANVTTRPHNTDSLGNLAPYGGSNFASVINRLQNQYLPNNSSQQTQEQQQQQQQQQQRQQQRQRGQPFDWHERANFICGSIKKRGLNPDDFGCHRPEEYVSANYSWRGYAKMVCERLETSYDTGLPETCGCPPTNWAGWTS
jgi:hypothetical protein